MEEILFSKPFCLTSEKNMSFTKPISGFWKQWHSLWFLQEHEAFWCSSSGYFLGHSLLFLWVFIFIFFLFVNRVFFFFWVIAIIYLFGFVLWQGSSSSLPLISANGYVGNRHFSVFNEFSEKMKVEANRYGS